MKLLLLAQASFHKVVTLSTPTCSFKLDEWEQVKPQLGTLQTTADLVQEKKTQNLTKLCLDHQALHLLSL